MEISEDLRGQLLGLLNAARPVDRISSHAKSDMNARISQVRQRADVPLEAILELTDIQKQLCLQVLNVWETGSVEGRYDAISIYADGPGGMRQITYGRSQTTEFGNLRELIEMYIAAGGTYASEFAQYVHMIGQQPLVDNQSFKGLLRDAGRLDPLMKNTQDVFFDQRYYTPAMKWAGRHGFTSALSGLVIYDSFIHSGSIFEFLRQRFPEATPTAGGREKVWVQQYVDVRHSWLSNHSNPVIQASRYRTRDLKREISEANWNLTSLPIMANGAEVWGATNERLSDEIDGLPARPDPGLVDWSELEPPITPASLRASRATRSELAADILASPNIGLATVHVSGISDNANARQNIRDTANGLAARRSNYGNAPGGTVLLDVNMLSGLLALAEDYEIEISELCGASHSATSRHYKGKVADITHINGIHIHNNPSNPGFGTQREFQERCRDLGANEVLGPGDAGHSRHIHAGWPL
jgi:chitosanase